MQSNVICRVPPMQQHALLDRRPIAEHYCRLESCNPVGPVRRHPKYTICHDLECGQLTQRERERATWPICNIRVMAALCENPSANDTTPLRLGIGVSTLHVSFDPNPNLPHEPSPHIYTRPSSAPVQEPILLSKVPLHALARVVDVHTSNNPAMRISTSYLYNRMSPIKPEAQQSRSEMRMVCVDIALACLAKVSSTTRVYIALGYGGINKQSCVCVCVDTGVKTKAALVESVFAAYMSTKTYARRQQLLGPYARMRTRNPVCVRTAVRVHWHCCPSGPNHHCHTRTAPKVSFDCTGSRVQFRMTTILNPCCCW
jgi:hypothetical protein